MSDVTSFQVTGDWRHIVDDGMVDLDALPDEALPTGSVHFTPLYPHVAVAGSPATAYTLAPITSLIAGGVLTDLQGREGVWLAGRVGTQTVRWRATINLEYQHEKIQHPSIDFDLGTDVRLSAIIQQAEPLPAIVVDPRVEALAQRLDEADQLVTDVQGYASDAAGYVSDAEAQVVLAKGHADRAEGLSTAQDQAVADVVVAGGPTTTALDASYVNLDLVDTGRLSEAALNATYGTKEELTGKADRAELDPLVPLAGIMPTIQQTRAGSAAARNVGLGDRLPRHVKLIQADSTAETPANYSGMTITHHADSPWGQGIPAWSGVSDSAAVRFNVTFGTPPAFTGTVPSVIGIEVWMDRVPAGSAIQVLLRGGAGTWSRYSNQGGSSHDPATGGIPLRPGSNIVRINAAASLPANIPGSTSNEVRFDVPAGTRVWVRRTWVETPLKPRVAFIVDWGAKSGYEAWKQDLHPLGVPMTAALRVGRLGTGTPPNDHMTVADVKELIALGGSASIHSFEGAAMSGMTPEQVRADLTAAISELQRQGIYTDGALHRAAWTQNLAPNALAVKDMMVTARTYSDSTPVTPWPPTIPLSMPARRIDDAASTDAKFAEIKSTNSMWLGFIHGVTPTGDANHISQANWDYFVSKVAAEVSAGTTEFVTIEDLARRERLFHLPHLGLV